LSLGPQAMTDAELIAILVRVGLKGTSAVELGRQLLKRFGSLRGMVEAPLLALLDVKGLKGAKAAQLLAAMEVARRVTADVGLRNRIEELLAEAGVEEGDCKPLLESLVARFIEGLRDYLSDDKMPGKADTLEKVLAKLLQDPQILTIMR